MLNSNIIDVVIIGAGVSGMTAALYLKRANKNVIILENSVPGGQLTKIPSIENYPGFLEIAGPDLAMNIYSQIQNEKIQMNYGKVVEIKKLADEFAVLTENGELRCKNVVIASGRNPRKLGIPNEDSLFGKGLSYCALCDGNFYKDKTVAVVGGADSALSEAVYLSNIAKKVYIIYRGKSFRAQDYLVKRVLDKDNIIPIYESNIKELLTNNNKLCGVRLDNETIDIDGLFIYIGFTPNSDMVRNTCELDNGYIIVNNDMETNVSGIYAIGDVALKKTYQIATAVGEAVTCANAIINKK